jgi:hypothetical protein
VCKREPWRFKDDTVVGMAWHTSGRGVGRRMRRGDLGEKGEGYAEGFQTYLHCFM